MNEPKYPGQYAEVLASLYSQMQSNPEYGAGNINLNNRPMYKNPDGSISTVDSMSFNDSGKEVLVPTVGFGANGQPIRMTPDQAIQRYYDTGEYLGKFDSIPEADRYAEQLHNDQANYYLNGGNPNANAANAYYSILKMAGLM